MLRLVPDPVTASAAPTPGAAPPGSDPGDGGGRHLASPSPSANGANVGSATAALEAALARLAPLHDHLCPRQVLGVRIGLHAAALLGVPVPQADKRLIAFVEIDGCFADGVMVATGCSLGHRTMRLVDHGKAAVTLLDTATGLAVRVWPRQDARTRATAHAPAATDRWHAQLEGYRDMPVDDLLTSAPVRVLSPPTTSDRHPPARVRCGICGEEVMGGREVGRAGRPLCRGCAGDAYVVRDTPPR